MSYPCLKERATQLASSHIDIVGPFDMDIVHLGQQPVADSYRHSFCQEKLLLRRKKRRVQYKGEGKVAAWLTLPSVASLSDTSRLTISPKKRQLLNLPKVEELAIMMSGIDDVEM